MSAHGRLRAPAGLSFVLVLLFGAEVFAQESTIVQKRSIDRTLQEYLFFGAQLGVRHRNIVYAEDAAPGPGARNELRVYVNGTAQSGVGGPLSAYVGLGFVGRSAADLFGDPIADPYDDFLLRRNLRVFGAYGEWAHRDENRREQYVIRAGRLSDYDARARLLTYDGLFARLSLGDHVGLTLFGGRRAVLDGDLPDERTDVLAQLAAGGDLRLLFGDLRARLGYRLEEIHRAILSLSLLPELFSLTLGGEVLLGGKSAAELDPTTSDAGLAAIIYLNGDVRSASGATGLIGWLEVQLGTDPRPFGRGGLAPSQLEIDAASRTPLSASRLDRLFLGQRQPHFLGELTFEHWLVETVAISAGAFGRIPLEREKVRSLQPATIEGWLGPELLLASGIRAALQVRYALEDPGAPGRIFTFVGDGVRRYGSLRLFGEVPIPLGERWALSVRPEGEGFFFSTEGPLSRTANQLGFAAGAVAAVKAGQGFSIAGRYGVVALPEFGADRVEAIHEVEVWVGGAY